MRTRLHHSDRANVRRAAAPRRWGGAVLLNFVTALASDAAYAQPGLCASRAPPANPHRRSACARASGHAPIRRRCLVPLRCPDRSASAIFCPHIAVPRTQAAKRATPNPWRLAGSCMASGRAPAAQNCPRSRTRLMPCFRRLLGAANAARASEAGGWEQKLGSARPSRNLRVGTRPGIERRHRVFRSRDAGRRGSVAGVCLGCQAFEAFLRCG